MKRLKSVPDLFHKNRWYPNRLSLSPADADLVLQYLIINLGMSSNFGFVDLEHLPFPVTMSVDWIRVYQQTDSINYTCDPPEFPTQAYINTYSEAYHSQFFGHPPCSGDRLIYPSDPNLTTWVDDFKQPNPKNSFLGEC